MEHTLERIVRVLEKIEKDLSGIKSELAEVNSQGKPRKRPIGSAAVNITGEKGVNRT